MMDRDSHATLHHKKFLRKDVVIDRGRVEVWCGNLELSRQASRPKKAARAPISLASRGRPTRRSPPAGVERRDGSKTVCRFSSQYVSIERLARAQ